MDSPNHSPCFLTAHEQTNKQNALCCSTPIHGQNQQTSLHYLAKAQNSAPIGWPVVLLLTYKLVQVRVRRGKPGYKGGCSKIRIIHSLGIYSTALTIIYTFLQTGLR